MIAYAYGAITLYGGTFQILQLNFHTHVAVLQPPEGRNLQGLGCSPFARHYLGNHYCFLFLQVLRCFSSLGWLHLDVSSSTIRVAPFGDLRISGRLHLPEAFRSLPRPSSPARAKAFTMCPFLLSCQCRQFQSYSLCFLSICQRTLFLWKQELATEYRNRTGDLPDRQGRSTIELIHLISISLPPLRQCIRIGIKLLPDRCPALVENIRVEPMTLPVSTGMFYPAFSLFQYKLNRCSTLVENIGVEPMTLPVSTGMLYPAFSLFQYKLNRCSTLVENIGVEPMTPCLQSRCSSQLS